MYILAILAIILSVAMMTGSSMYGFEVLTVFLDPISVLLLAVTSVPILIASGMVKDLKKAVQFCGGKRKANTLAELKKAEESVNMLMQTMIYSGGFIFLFTAVMILGRLDKAEYIGPNLAISLLSLIYALVINIFLLAIKGKLKLMSIEFMQE